MRLPDILTCYNGVKVDKVEGMGIFLKRFAYPCRYLDMIPRFARPVPQLCMISNLVMDHIYTTWNHLLSAFNQEWLSIQNLIKFSDAVCQKSGAIDNCFGFVDGTVRPVSRPGKNQRVLYNGHKKVHAIKFQSLAVPNGLVANLYGPVEGKKHDSSMLVLDCTTNWKSCTSHLTDVFYVYMETLPIPIVPNYKDHLKERM